jgi:hypothetical protein
MKGMEAYYGPLSRMSRKNIWKGLPLSGFVQPVAQADEIAFQGFGKIISSPQNRQTDIILITFCLFEMEQFPKHIL